MNGRQCVFMPANPSRHARNSVTRQNFFFSSVHAPAEAPSRLSAAAIEGEKAPKNPSYAGSSAQIPPITVFPPVSEVAEDGGEHAGLLAAEPGGGVRFRQVAWVRSSLLAGVVTSQDKTQ